MKKIILFASVVIIGFYSCKKEEEAKPEPTQQTQSKQQDEKLLGFWVQDSSQMDGGSVAHNDTVDMGGGELAYAYISHTITKDFMIDSLIMPHSVISFKKTWETSGDSLFQTLSTGDEDNHYKYKVSGNFLELYLDSKMSSDIKYWYHKVK